MIEPSPPSCDASGLSQADRRTGRTLSEPPAPSTAPAYALVVTSADAITPYADLDELLVELLGHWQRILGDDLVGAYLQGSFALGGGDQQSDCDWLVATRDRLTKQRSPSSVVCTTRYPLAMDTGPTISKGPMRRRLNSSRSITSAGSGCSTTTATAPWNGTTTATGVTPAGSCVSTASR